LHRPIAASDYGALLDRDDIDAVYIALPTAVRKPWVIAAAKAKKHVLCEKPAAVHGDDLAEMIDACRSSGVGFMDGVMFDHSRRIPALRDVLGSSKTFGTLRRIQSHFSFHGGDDFSTNDIRADATLEPHGCLGDLGWYCIRLTLWATNGQMPSSVSGETVWSIEKQSADGIMRDVPGEFRGEMRFNDGLTAGLFCSFRCVNQQTAMLTGSQGYVTLDDFVLPFVGAESQFQLHRHELQISGGRWNYGRHSQTFSVAEHASDQPDSQEVAMVRTIASWALGAAIDQRAADRALQTQRILDAMRQSDVSGGRFIPIPESLA
ncbi:MAG: Gfo/Idh/MocA family oxidoreductase, partial [Planctomycetota bacterium]